MLISTRYIMKPKHFFKGKRKQGGIFWLIVYLPSTCALLRALTPRLFARPATPRTRRFLPLHSHVAESSVSLTGRTLITGHPYSTVKISITSEGPLPTGRRRRLGMGRLRGPSRLSCLVSVVSASLGALDLVVSFTSGDLLKLPFANKCEP